MKKIYVLVLEDTEDRENIFIGIDRASGGYPYLTKLHLCARFKTPEDAKDYNTLGYKTKVMVLELKEIEE